jgi:hypothetical protein
LVIKDLIQGDKVGDYVVKQVLLVAASFQVPHVCLPNWGPDGGREVPHVCLPNWGPDGGREVPHRCGDEVFFVDSAQVAEVFSEGQRIGIPVSKPCGGHAPRLDVGVAVASRDGEDHSTAKSAELLILSAVVPRALSDTEALQGVDEKARKTRLLLAHALGPSIFRHLKTKVELNRLWWGTRDG